MSPADPHPPGWPLRRALRTTYALLALGLAACALIGAPAASAAQQVSYPQLLEQVRSGPLIRAVINRRGKDIEIKFRDQSEWRAFFPPGAQPQLQRILHARHIRVIFAAPPHARHKPHAVHHHLRYIAAGVLGALALAAAVMLIVRARSRRRSDEARARPGQPPAG